MNISRMKIENFRSVKGPLEIDFGQINALVGQNNTGKTNILLAIQKILGSSWLSVNTFNEDDVYLRDPDRDIIISFDLCPPHAYYAFKEADPVEIKTLEFKYTRYKVGENKGARRLDRRCLDSRGNAPQVLTKAPRSGEQRKYQPLIGIPNKILENLPVIFIGARRSIREQLPWARYSMLKPLLDDIDIDFRRIDNVVEYTNKEGEKKNISRLKLFDHHLKLAMKLLKTEDFQKLEASIRGSALHQLGFDPKTDTDKLDFYFSPFTSLDFYRSLKLMIKEGEFSINATELGDGIQNALVISILKAFEERRKQGAIFLIEEPEMYLHPQMQRSLYKTLRAIGEQNQLIYTTHSPHFVTIPEYDEVVIITKDNNGTDKRKSGLAIDKIRREKIRKEFDPERNELFFAKKVLLVEGDTEKLSFPEYAKKVGVDLDNAGLTIVEVGGKKSLLEFIEIAISFNIPIGIVYDIDSGNFNVPEEEKAYNKKIESYRKADGSVGVWSFDKKYEDELRKYLGEKKYIELCGRYPGHTNAVKQRLIAADTESGSPDFIKPIISWLSK